MTNAPTILQVLPRLESGGVERGTVEITQAIAAAGMVPLVASAGGQMVAQVVRAGGEHITLPLDSKSPLVMWKNANALARIIRTRNVNILHARSRAPAWSAWLAAKRTGIKYVTTFHGVYGLEAWYKRPYNAIMAKGDRIIAVSQFVEDYIAREYGVGPERVRLIHRGVDFSQFDDKHLHSATVLGLAREWDLPDEQVPLIFCPGRITPIKGQNVLIDALGKIRDEKFLCIIAGRADDHSDYLQRLEAQIATLGLNEKIRIRAATQAMNEAYSLSEIVVIPSVKTESFGRVSIEAQAMGKLVIATGHGGVMETLIPNETGYLVPPGDAEALAAAIQSGLHRDQPTKLAMASYAKQHVRRFFSLQEMQDKTIALYRELLA